MSDVANTILICIGNHFPTNQACIQQALNFYKSKQCNSIKLLKVIDTTDPIHKGLFVFNKIINQNQHENIKNNFQELISSFNLKKSKNIINSIIKEGYIYDEIIKEIQFDPTISFMILGCNSDSSTKGKLISHITEQIPHNINIPVLLIPEPNLK